MRGRTPNDLQRIIRNHVKVLPNGCWEWKGCRDKRGYGYCTYHGKQYQAHRILYILTKGPVPPRKELHHLCEYKRCVNPEHTSPHYHIYHMGNFHTKQVKP